MITILSRPLCSGCIDAKEMLRSQGYDYKDLDVTTIEGMALLARYFDGPDSILPCIIVDDHETMAKIIEILPDVDVIVERTY